MKSLFWAFIFGFVFTGNAYAVDAILFLKSIHGEEFPINISNVRVKHLDNSVDEYLTLLESDGGKYSLPLSSVEGLYITGNNCRVVKKSEQQFIMEISPRMPLQIIAENDIGGIISFNVNSINRVKFR